MELLKFIAGEFLHIEPKAYLFALSLGLSRVPHCTRGEEVYAGSKVSLWEWNCHPTPALPLMALALCTK